MFALVLVAGSAGNAAAEPPETPNGWVGACNMVAAWTPDSPGGMDDAMWRNANQGNNTQGYHGNDEYDHRGGRLWH